LNHLILPEKRENRQPAGLLGGPFFLLFSVLILPQNGPKIKSCTVWTAGVAICEGGGYPWNNLLQWHFKPRSARRLPGCWRTATNGRARLWAAALAAAGRRAGRTPRAGPAGYRTGGVRGKRAPKLIHASRFPPISPRQIIPKPSPSCRISSIILKPNRRTASRTNELIERSGKSTTGGAGLAGVSCRHRTRGPLPQAGGRGVRGERPAIPRSTARRGRSARASGPCCRRLSTPGAALHHGGSSSLREENCAGRSFASLCLTLQVHLQEAGLAPTAVLEGDAEAFYTEALRTLEGKVRQRSGFTAPSCLACRSCQAARAPKRYKACAAFSNCYDPRFFAHELPRLFDRLSARHPSGGIPRRGGCICWSTCGA
jgi:hypothetical protein